jgi:hypothetical protein
VAEEGLITTHASKLCLPQHLFKAFLFFYPNNLKKRGRGSSCSCSCRNKLLGSRVESARSSDSRCRSSGGTGPRHEYLGAGVKFCFFRSSVNLHSWRGCEGRGRCRGGGDGGGDGSGGGDRGGNDSLYKAVDVKHLAINANVLVVGHLPVHDEGETAHLGLKLAKSHRRRR